MKAPDHPLLAARNVSAGYGAAPVVSGASFELRRGERLALLGPNGAGKSTLLLALGGLLKPAAGRVELQGRPLEAWSPRDRARVMAAVPQTIGAPVALSVRDAVATGRLPHLGDWSGWSAGDQGAVEDAIAAVDLAGLRDRTLDQLSAGERQRVWLAMALAQDPRILLLDEPTAHLDVHHAWTLLHLVTRLANERELAVLFSTHDLNLAATFATRIVLLKAGRIAAAGTADEVLNAAILSDVYGHPMKVEQIDGKPRIWPA